MTDENKIEKIEIKNECFCKSTWFREFLARTLAGFVGVYCALSLFAALHKPPMPPCPFTRGPMMRPPVHCYHHHNHFNHAKFKKGEFYRKNIEKREISPDKIKIEVKD